MKQKLACLTLLLPLTTGFGAEAVDPHENHSNPSAQVSEETPATILAAQVKEIASSATTSRREKAKLIANAVRLAITTAMEGVKDPVARLRVALDLATAAAKAAPHFAVTITNAVSAIPALAGIEGALAQIQAAVRAGVEATTEADVANPSGNPRPPANPDFGGPNRGETVVSPSH